MAVPPKLHRFQDKEAQKLAEQLHAQDATEPVLIDRPEDVMLNVKGRVQRDYQFTTIGFSQLCSALAPGLAQFLNNLAELRQRESEETDWGVYSSRKAIEILNTMIQLRFENCLAGYGLIIDAGNHVVEGIVGPRYQFFSNVELFDRCQEFASGLASPAEFHSAALAGRRLLLHYRNPEPACMVTTSQGREEPYHLGWFFSNSEIGDCSVHAGLALYRGLTGTAAIYQIGRLMHVKGSVFGGKFQNLLTQLQEKGAEEAAQDFSAHAERLFNQPLNLGGDPMAHVKRVQTIVGRLARARFARTVVKKAVNRAMICGSYRHEHVDLDDEAAYDVLDPELLRAFRSRNMYDLFNALTHVARGLVPSHQEGLEALAYKLFTDRFRLPM